MQCRHYRQNQNKTILHSSIKHRRTPIKRCDIRINLRDTKALFILLHFLHNIMSGSYVMILELYKFKF